MDVLGVLGFGLAVALALLELWRQFWRKPKLEVTADWYWGEEHRVLGLYVFVSNTGHKKTVVKDLGLHLKDSHEKEFKTDKLVWEKLPVVLDVDEATQKFFFPARRYMREGRVETVVAIDHRGNFIYKTPPPMDADAGMDFRRE
jgi:hypothetical protein